MTTQSELVLENGLINTLLGMGYERVVLKEEDNLYSNFKRQLEKHNQKQLAQIGRTSLTDGEFERSDTLTRKAEPDNYACSAA